ncbi:MAG: type II secretion system GspH family protein [Planctomycetes bacterium]|nr:type II secretion system GspH family protein [Planctomycetota bacterium]
MTGPRMTGRGGFTLMEVVFAVAIVATALVALQATVAGSIQSAGTSVNRRAAREVCRAKLEEILAGAESPDGGGELEDRPGFRWSARSEELAVGMPERATEVVTVVVVEVTFPVFSDAGGAAGGAASSSSSAEAGMETISMASILPFEDGQAQPGGPR